MDNFFANVNQQAVKALKLRQQNINKSTLPSKAPFSMGKKVSSQKTINKQTHKSPVKGTKSPARSRVASKSPQQKLQASPAERFKVTSEFERCEDHPGEE